MPAFAIKVVQGVIVYGFAITAARSINWMRNRRNKDH